MSYKKLGFSTYDQYLDSDIFKGIKESVLKIHDNKCCCCGNLADQIHNIKYTYENMSGKNYKDLVSICKKCHHKIEFNKNGERISNILIINKNLNLLMSKERKLNLGHTNKKLTPDPALLPSKNNKCYCCESKCTTQYENYPICKLCHKKVAYINDSLIIDSKEVLENIISLFNEKCKGPKSRGKISRKPINMQRYEYLPVRDRSKYVPTEKQKKRGFKGPKKKKIKVTIGAALNLIPTSAPDKSNIERKSLKQFMKPSS